MDYDSQEEQINSSIPSINVYDGTYDHTEPKKGLVEMLLPEEEKFTGCCSVLTITLKDEEKTLRSKHLLYESYCVHPDDPVIKQCIARALKDFNGEPSDVKIRINLEL